MAFTKWEIGECCCGGIVDCSGCSIPEGTDLTFTCGPTTTTLHYVGPGWITDPCVPVVGTTYFFFASFTCPGTSAGMDIFVYGDSGCTEPICLADMPSPWTVDCTPLTITFRIAVGTCAVFYGVGVDNYATVTL